MGKIFERTARTLLYTALMFGMYKIISFEAMIAFGFAVLMVSLDESISEIKK